MIRLEKHILEKANPRLQKLPAGIILSDPPIIVQPTRDESVLRLFLITKEGFEYLLVRSGKADFWLVEAASSGDKGFIEATQDTDGIVLSTDELIEGIDALVEYWEKKALVSDHSKG